MEENVDWLRHRFKEDCPWRQPDIDEVRVKWIKCFVSLANACIPAFFELATLTIRKFLYVNENPRLCVKMDVARKLVNTRQMEELSKEVEAHTTRISLEES